MATTFSSAIDVNYTKFSHNFTHPKRLPTKRFKISCNNVTDPQIKNPSLAEQLKPLSNTTLSDGPQKETQFKSKPKSTWVNPARRKPNVLNLQRHKKASYEYSPEIRDLKLFAKKLNQCDASEEAFMQVLDEIPKLPTRENALLVLNSLKPWEKTVLFFDWLKARKLFPIETIFYNVVMKSLRFGRQFEIVESLANEMIDNEVELDNITYSTIISCAKKCGLSDKAVEWFERMYKTGLMPDEVTYSAVLDVYAKLGKVEEAMSLYERGRASGWEPDSVAFAVLGKMYGEAGDYDGIRFVLQEMKALGVRPNLVVYNTLLEALGKAGKPGLARSLFEDMIDAGITPDAKTLTALVKIYGKKRWARDALELWGRMKTNAWPMDFYLYNTLLNMCADLGLEEEAEGLFKEMKGLQNFRPDSWSYTAMLNIYGSGGNVDKALELFEEMAKLNVSLNVMGCTCLIQCLGRAKKIDDLVRVYEFAMARGVRPDDKLCGCLLSVASYFEGEDLDKVLGCLEQASPKLFAFIKLLDKEDTVYGSVKETFKSILNNTAVEARRPFCNCLIDICRKRNLQERAHELLYIGSEHGLYPGLHTKTSEEWCLNVRSLSVGAAQTAFEEWVESLTKIVERKEALPELLSANTGAGAHKYSQGLANSFDLHVKELAAPFTQSEDKAGLFVATKEDIISWVQSKSPAVAVVA